jgi:hypothetical protein
VRAAKEGVIELWDFSIALDTGGMHPWLKDWQEKRAGAANRPPATARERHAQWYICLATVALDRVFSLGVGEARKLVAKKAARVFFDPVPTHRTIEHWQGRQPPLSPETEQVLAKAIAESRVNEPGGRDRLIDVFIGHAQIAMNPGLWIDTE